MFRTNVNEMNVQPIDLGDELRQGIQFRLSLAPVVVCAPIVRKFLNCREWYALRFIRDRFPIRPPCRVNAPAQFDKFRFWNIHVERTNIGLLSARLLCDLSDAIIHIFISISPAKTASVQQSRGNGCRCYAAKAAAGKSEGY